jgi:hypothetical protein
MLNKLETPFPRNCVDTKDPAACSILDWAIVALRCIASVQHLQAPTRIWPIEGAAPNARTRHHQPISHSTPRPRNGIFGSCSKTRSLRRSNGSNASNRSNRTPSSHRRNCVGSQRIQEPRLGRYTKRPMTRQPAPSCLTWRAGPRMRITRQFQPEVRVARGEAGRVSVKSRALP